MTEVDLVQDTELTPNHRPSNTSNILALLATAVIFFILGALMVYVVREPSENPASTNDQAAINDAVAATFVALTPTATPQPTDVPVNQSFEEHNPFLGPEDAPIVLVEFSDYQCPYCARFHEQTLSPLLEHYDGLIKFVYREYPIIGGQVSADMSTAAQCANLQGQYWEYTDLIWANQLSNERRQVDSDLLGEFAETAELDLDVFNTCLDEGTGFDLVVTDFEAGRDWNVSATPGFFINGTRYSFGAQPLDVFLDVIDAELVELGISPPERSS